MPPSREIFWNVPLGAVILYPLAAITVAILVYSVYKRYQLWRSGKGSIATVKLSKRLINFLTFAINDGLVHKRILKDPYPGIMHFFIFWGFLALLVAAALDGVSHYIYPFLEGTFYLVFSLVTDAFGIVILIGVAIATYRRYIQRPDRLDNTIEDAVALVLIFLMVLTGYFVEGFRISATELVAHPDWAIWSPVGLVIARAFANLAESSKLVLHNILWWFHTFLVLGAVAYVSLSFSKLSHILVAPLNAFFRPLKPKGELEKIDVETAQTFGTANIREFSWKDLLDLDACTRCGRCQDNCPAYLSKKPLSPKKIIQSLKGQLVTQTGLSSSNSAHQDSKRTDLRVSTIGEVITEDEIWACTTCGACIVHCPVYISPLVKIIEIRRNLTLVSGKMPETIQLSLSSLQKRGHPWAGSQYLRLRDDWTKGLEIKRLSQDHETDVLFWVGCTAALDERVVKVILSMVNILQKAEVDFGILAEETCCGDPARRIGYELLYQELAQKNINFFKKYHVRKIVTLCPHCFNTMKHEYPKLDPELTKEEVKYEVLHHTQFISQLLRQGRLKLNTCMDQFITYHDPCYLGRYNDIYREPRKILASIPGLKKIEMKRSQEKSLCCGGGGGHLWIEEERGKRVNELRILDIAKTKAGTGITACPYCLHMLENAVEEKGLKEELKLLDIAELVGEAIK